MGTLENFYGKYGNVVLRDANGKPSIFVRHPKINSSFFDSSLPEHVHPAFVVNNETDDAVLIAKYESCELASGGTLYSLPNQIPAYGNYIGKIDQIRSFGNDASPMTIADHGLLVLMAHLRADYIAKGNMAQGTYGDEPLWTANQAVTKGTAVAYHGNKYICLIDHTTSNALNPIAAPTHWRYEEKIGGTVVDSNGFTATGSGPIDWNFLYDPSLEADVVGNSTQQLAGILLVDNEVWIMPDNNAADPATDIKATSTAWRAILPNANDDGYTLVTPGTEGTVHLWHKNNSPVYFGRAIEDSERSTGLATGNFKDVAFDADSLPHVPSILFELGLAPLPGTKLQGKFLVPKAKGTYICLRSGTYDFREGFEGIAYLGFNGTSWTSTHPSAGCPRIRARERASE